jgi:hypothetical protein
MTLVRPAAGAAQACSSRNVWALPDHCGASVDSLRLPEVRWTYILSSPT